MPGTFSSRVESGSDDHEPDDGSRRRWVAPVVTFVVGALLGGAAVGLVMRGQDAPAPVAAPTTSAPSTEPESAQVAVPRSCLAIADQAQELQQSIDTAVAAARDLDAARLSDLVRQIDEQQVGLRADTETCRRGVATATAVPHPSTATVTVTQGGRDPQTPEPTAEPTPTSTRSGDAKDEASRTTRRPTTRATTG